MDVKAGDRRKEQMKRLTFAMMVLTAGVALAQGPGGAREGRPGPGPGWMAEREGGMERVSPVVQAVANPQFDAELGITAEQRQKLDELAAAADAEGRALAEALKAAMVKQLQLLRAENIDEAAVMAAIDETFELRKAAAKRQTKRLIAVKGILTPEQQQKADRMFGRLRGPRGEGEEGGMRGPRGKDGEEGYGRPEGGWRHGGPGMRGGHGRPDGEGRRGGFPGPMDGDFDTLPEE